MRQSDCGHVAAAAPGRLDLAGVHEGLEERPRGHDDGPRPVSPAAAALDADDPAALDQERLDHLLAEREVLLAFDGQLGQELVSLLVALGARAVHRRPLAAVEQPELERRRVREQSHRATEGVDLADDLTLGHPPDRRIAAHLGDRVAVDRQERGPQPHPRRRERGFQPGMAGADHDHVEVISHGGVVVTRDRWQGKSCVQWARVSIARARPRVWRAS